MRMLTYIAAKLKNNENRSIVRFLCFVFPLNFGGFILQFLTAIICARLLEINEYGSYVYAITIITIFALFVGSGLDQVALREIPKLLLAGNKKELFGFCGNLCINFISQTFLVFIVTSWLIYTEILYFNFNSLIILSAAFFLGLSNVTVGMLQSLGFIVFPQMCIRFLQPLMLLIAILFYHKIFDKISPNIILSLYVCISGLTAIYLLIKLVMHLFPKTKPDYITLNNSLPMFWTGISVAFVGASYILNANIDMLMINWYLGNEEVGLYRIANRGAFVVGVCLIVMNQVLYPVLSKQLASSNISIAQNTINVATTLLFVFGSVGSCIMFFGIDYFIILFGEKYSESSFALKILLLGACVDVFLGAAGPILLLQNKEKFLIATNVTSIMLNIMLNSILLPIFGLEGAAVATVVATIIAKLMLVYFVLNKTSFKIFKYN